MRKALKNGVLLLLMMFFMFSACKKSDDRKSEEYFREINSIIKDMEFYKAKTAGNKILLYDAENKLITEMPFEKYDPDIDFVYAYKDGTVICFVTDGSVDDEKGIMFVNDGSDDILAGIHSVERIGGNSYRYSTYGE